MNLKRGQVLKGYKSIVCGALALGLAACSMPVKMPALGGPPDRPQDVSCELSMPRECACSLSETISTSRSSLQGLTLSEKPRLGS